MLQCPDKPSIQERPLMTEEVAEKLENLFKVFSNRNRLRILNCIARSERECVSRIAELTGLSQQVVSNQLKLLIAMKLVRSEREGSYSFYSINDHCIYILLERGLCILEESDQIKDKRSPAIAGE